MLQLLKGKPAAVAVPLGGGAVVNVRPATTFLMTLAGNKCAALFAGIINAGPVAAAEALGDDFADADFTQPQWRSAAAESVLLIELAATCVEGWSGVTDEAGNPIEAPTRETLALLLRDHDVALVVRAAIQAPVNRMVSEPATPAAPPTG